MSAGRVVASFGFKSGGLEEALEFLKRLRSELRMVRKVRVYRDRVQIVDVNGDWFEIEGLGYPDAEIVPVLSAVNAAFKRESIHRPTADVFLVFCVGWCFVWV